MTEAAFQPIPPGIRVGLRNTLGDLDVFDLWEIDDLFEIHGFSEKGEAPDHVWGPGRSLVEEYQAPISWASQDERRRYLSLVEDVLRRYPEHIPARDELGLALGRAGVIAADDGSLNLIAEPTAAAANAGQVLAIAGESVAGDDIWTTGRLRIFMSHIAQHKAEVKRIADALESGGFSCFVAHVDITPSAAWQSKIEEALDTCHVLVAYVTVGFRDSNWTDQEVGWVLGRGLPVIPVKAGEDPYGFFGAYQAVSVPAGSPADVMAAAITEAICNAIFSPARTLAAALAQHLSQTLVDAFCRSPSWSTTRQLFRLLERIPAGAVTPGQAAQLRQAATDNYEITEAGIEYPKGQWGRGPEVVERYLTDRGHGLAKP